MMMVTPHIHIQESDFQLHQQQQHKPPIHLFRWQNSEIFHIESVYRRQQQESLKHTTTPHHI